MIKIIIYNSLSRREEVLFFNNKVGVYTCGPTVYDYVTIGNWRTYCLGDLMVRVLKYAGYEVNYYMNITDVGHLTGDNEGDADAGEDRMEKGAKREGTSAWKVAEFYLNDFLVGFEQLHLTKPEKFVRATDHIKEQIDLVLRIEELGLAYKIDDGIYFNVLKYEQTGNVYGELSTLEQLKVGGRVEFNILKKDPRDFALWKFSPAGVKRDMEWDSPWGRGFPGWHIECSAMSMKYLGSQFDVHIGGEDLRSTHHPNEIAQSEVSSGRKPFVKYWLHGAFLLIDGGRMGKSLGNAYTLHDVHDRGFSSTDLRYFYLTGHYRKQLNFTWKALEAAQTAVERLRDWVLQVRREGNFLLMEDWSSKYKSEMEILNSKFERALGDDLDMPAVLALLWSVVRTPDKTLPAEIRLKIIESWDQVLGLDMNSWVELVAPDQVKQLHDSREILRQNKMWNEADKLRKEIEKCGFRVIDTATGSKLRVK